MPETLSVHLNREAPRELTPEADAVEVDRSFVLEFENHGGPQHVHLHLNDALASAMKPSETQVYVGEEETRRVDLTVPDDHGPTKGHIDLSTGYGAEETRVNVTLTDERKDGGPDVAVDNTLGEKHEVEESTASSMSAVGGPAVLAAIAVVVAAGIAVSVSDAGALVVGALGLLGGIAVALYLLFW